jgi:EF-P beta-lysylation protein EpmB
LENIELSTAIGETRLMPGLFTAIGDLLDFLELESGSAPYPIFNRTTPLLVSRNFAARMRKNDWYDPLLLQVLPRFEESIAREGFDEDPVRDRSASVVQGVLQKYRGRALLLTCGKCSIHCRYCFRRSSNLSACEGPEAYEEAIGFIERNGSLAEVILSGGDPLCLPPLQFKCLAGRLAAIAHVNTIRVHTRLPVADPGKVADHLETFEFLSKVKNCIVVIHANHVAELEDDCPAALSDLRSTGALLLNQSVLLRHINDRAEVLADLSKALLDNGVMPYYLHQLDRVKGSWHFETSIARGRELMGELRRMLPGYALPRYVREIAGEQAKMPL